MEKLEERYLKWVLVEDRTTGYLIKEELQREKLRTEKRAWEFEKRLEEGKGSELARMCWEEIKERGRKEKSESD